MLQLLPTVIIALRSHAHHNHLAKACLRQFSCSHVSTLTRKLISLPAATILHCSYLSPKNCYLCRRCSAASNHHVLWPSCLVVSQMSLKHRDADANTKTLQNCPDITILNTLFGDGIALGLVRVRVRVVGEGVQFRLSVKSGRHSLTKGRCRATRTAKKVQEGISDFSCQQK